MKNWKKITLISASAIILLLICYLSYSLFFWRTKKEATFTVKSGTGTIQIAKNLEQKELVNSSFSFIFYYYLRQWYVKTGVYKIEAGTNLVRIAQLLKEGKIEENAITIPEGWSVKQIDEYLAEKKILNSGEFIKVAKDKEGYLFPDTYQIPKKVNAEDIKEIMLENFEKRTNDLKIDKQTIILASIVEREAKIDSDRPKIAAVYLNRVKIGMKLEADPTVQYAKGSWDQITRADYKNVISPYNTYLNEGLPPGPICNPGLKSIQAVVNPESSDYLYFFHKTDGYAVYSKTLEEHTTNWQKNR